MKLNSKLRLTSIALGTLALSSVAPAKIEKPAAEKDCPMNATLPPRETSVHAPFNSASARIAPHRPRHVLVIDDDTTTRQITALFLARSGYLVDTAEDGERGWDALRSAPYNLLVTDNDMPRLTGMKLVERLRSAGLTLPVIIASGSVELGEAENYPWLALAAVLHKPFSFSDLISAALRAAPIAPDSGEGSVHCLEPQRDNSIHFPFPAHTNAHPEGFAQTA